LNKEIRISNLILVENETETILEVYAIVFDSETMIDDEKRGFIEVIEPTALLLTNMKDVSMKYNHQDNF
jgi:phage head maturation protease